MPRCNFDGCRFAGSSRAFAEAPGERDLCDSHFEQVQVALGKRDSVRVRWGDTRAELIARYERDAQELRLLYPEEPQGPNWDPFADEEDADYWGSPAVRAWERIYYLEESLAGLRDDLKEEGDRPARVSVDLVTEERPQRRRRP